MLVTRGRLRRVVSGLAALLSLGLVAAVVVGARRRARHVRDAVRSRRRLPSPLDRLVLGRRGGPPLAVLPALAALRLVPSWPEMGRRYDAPPGRRRPAKAPEEQENLDLWKAMDEGRDPTA